MKTRAQIAHDYHIHHRDEIRLRKHGWNKVNGASVVARVRASGYRSYREHIERLKEAVVNVLTNGEGTCRWCGQGDLDVLCLDHIDNDGSARRRQGQPRGGAELCRWIVKNDYPSGFQVLCANCNLKKHVMNLRDARLRRNVHRATAARELAHNPKECLA